MTGRLGLSQRTRDALSIALPLLAAALAAVHFLRGAHRTTAWPITFLYVALPILYALLNWSFKRDMRAHLAGKLVIPERKLEIEVNTAMATMFAWIGLATYAGLKGLPEALGSGWLMLAVFAVWLAWFVTTLRRARGYAFTLR